MNYSIINPDVDLKPIEDIMVKFGKIIPVPASELKPFDQEYISVFCHKHALYQLPTTELIDFIKNEIDGFAIEIGAGNGCIGRSLGIKMTDNFLQQRAIMKDYYESLGQPTINYGDDVEKIGAIKSIKTYRPNTVIGCWITPKIKERMMTVSDFHGIDENEIFPNGVKKYIHVGNENIHSDKPLLKRVAYKEYKFPWLISRSMSREKNVIYIFQNNL